MKHYYLQIVHGDVEPALVGPFVTALERDRRALEHRSAYGEDDGLFKLDVWTEEGLADPQVEVSWYTGGFFDQHLFRNYYKHCGKEWNNTWSSMCNDECPKCGKEIEPYESEDLEIEEG